MSLVAIGLFVLACGWNVYRLFLPTRAAALRNEGHPQYFGAALAAGYIAFLAIFLHAASAKLDWYSPVLERVAQLAPQADKEPSDSKGHEGEQSPNSPLVIGHLIVEGGGVVRQLSIPAPAAAAAKPKVLAASKPAPYITVLAVGFWAAILALLLPFILNAPFLRNARLRLLAGRKSFNDVEEALLDALERGTSVAITLTTGKVYIGLPNEFDPNGDEADWVSILPLASGYRTRKGRLRLTTTYEDAYEKIDGDKDIGLSSDDFKITLPLNHIVSIQTFKLSFYIQHFANHADEDEGELTEAIEAEDAAAITQSVNSETAAVVSEGPATGLRPESVYWSVPDIWLKSLKWTFHLAFTAAVVCLPFSLVASFVLVALSAFVLVLVRDPADVQLTMLLDAMREA